MSADRATIKRGITDALPLFVPAVPFALVIGLAIVEGGVNPLAGGAVADLWWGGSPWSRSWARERRP